MEDLLKVLENIIYSLDHPNLQARNVVQLEPIEDFDFDQYLVKFEKILEENENFIIYSLKLTGTLLFSKIIEKLERIDVARIFIALLHYGNARKDRFMVQLDESNDIEIRRLHLETEY